MFVFEAIIAFLAAILFFVSGGSHGKKPGANKVQPNPQEKTEQVSRSVPPPPSDQATNPSTQATPIPTPALLPGMIIFLVKTLRQKKLK